LYRCRSSVP